MNMLIKNLQEQRNTALDSVADYKTGLEIIYEQIGSCGNNDVIISIASHNKNFDEWCKSRGIVNEDSISAGNGSQE